MANNTLVAEKSRVIMVPRTTRTSSFPWRGWRRTMVRVPRRKIRRRCWGPSWLDWPRRWPRAPCCSFPSGSLPYEHAPYPRSFFMLVVVPMMISCVPVSGPWPTNLVSTVDDDYNGDGPVGPFVTCFTFQGGQRPLLGPFLLCRWGMDIVQTKRFWCGAWEFVQRNNLPVESCGTGCTEFQNN